MALAMLIACSGGSGGGGGSSDTTLPPTFLPPAQFSFQPTPRATENRAADGTANRYALGIKDPWFMLGGGFEQDNSGASILTVLEHDYIEASIPMLHRRLEGSNNTPHPAVLQAWHAGWTGRGVNILIIDEFGSPTENVSATHGYGVALSAYRIAIGGNYFAMDHGGLLPNNYRKGGLQNIHTGQEVSADTKIDALNLSYFRVDSAFFTEEFADFSGGASAATADLTFLTGTGDAVITVSAGNSDIPADQSQSAFSLVDSDNPSADFTRSRTLIVGRVLSDREPRPPGTSGRIRGAFAGTDPQVNSRFLVEDGRARAFRLCDREVTDSCENIEPARNIYGTSYAAPRVAGYAALVRHKFPNLSGTQTASILLDTATYDGLVDCDDASLDPANCLHRYGQGRVDISGALAPVGALQ